MKRPLDTIKPDFLLTGTQEPERTPPRLPRGPVMTWAYLGRRDAAELPSLDALREIKLTSSGRAALFHALKLLALPAGSAVLVPTYHCPTVVAPVVCAGLTPQFFGLDSLGLPNLDAIDPASAAQARAMIVPHYFGLPRSLAAVRAWCDQRGIFLIEDCAHSFFGVAGDRPIGAWGDFATASLSKFFPVPEGGLLASNTMPLDEAQLSRPSLKAQIKGCLDVMEHAATFRALRGISDVLRPFFALKNRRNPAPPIDTPDDGKPLSPEAMMQGCDMGRIGEAPVLVTALQHRHLARGRIIANRQRNYLLYQELLDEAVGMRALFRAQTLSGAPYVFPLWVDADRVDRVYAALRKLSMPVFRWDRVWHSTPALQGDHGQLWSKHVLQLLCHQDLNPADIRLISETVRHLARA